MLLVGCFFCPPIFWTYPSNDNLFLSSGFFRTVKPRRAGFLGEIVQVLAPKKSNDLLKIQVRSKSAN